MIAAALLIASMAQTQEIGFEGATGLTLLGELTLPEGDGPFPAVLLLPGSGPTDRNGNQLPLLRTDLLKQLAEHFAKSGIATFRFDKRPVARYAAKWPTESTEKLSEFFSFENHVADVEAAFAVMSKAEKVDPKRCAILGHSEGGLFASWLAPKIKPRAVVLAATAGNTMDSVIRYQIGRNLARPGVPEQLRNEITESNEAAMRSIIETGKLPEKVHANLAPLYNPSALKLIRSYLTIDPIVRLKQYDGHVLVINGEKDVQVRADVDAKRLFEALQSRQGDKQSLVIVPDASHNFKEVKSESNPGFVGPVVEDALQKVTEWLKSIL